MGFMLQQGSSRELLMASFDLTVAGNEATAAIIDRSKHNVRYGSNSFLTIWGTKR